MSHFALLVILPATILRRDRVTENKLATMLEPFNENREVPEYERDCFCIGGEAKRRAREQAENSTLGTWDELREQYWALPEEGRPTWPVFTAKLQELQDNLEKAQGDYNRPDPDCENCAGTGKYLSEYNPDSKWDWFQIGGRWTGALTGYDPDTDPANQESCIHCGGTGDRPGWVTYVDGVRTFADDWAKECNGCNACRGKGKATKWPTQFAEYTGDVQKVKDIIPDFSSFAVLTPDGVWHEKGDMGWFGMVANEKDTWPDEYKALMAQYSDNLAVIVDCHI